MSVDLTGFFSDGGSIFASLPVTTDWTTHALSGFVNLISLDIVAIDPTPLLDDVLDSAIDNLYVGAIPEPSTVLLLGTGLVGLLGYGWRRNRTAR